jgi:hypothetical protein
MNTDNFVFICVYPCSSVADNSSTNALNKHDFLRGLSASAVKMKRPADDRLRASTF